MKSRDEVFATLEVAKRVWAVAAVHGEAERLAALHRELARRFAAGDRLVYLGNYLGHGPDVPGVLDELLWFRRDLLIEPGLEPWDIVYLRGAQEEMWLKLLQIQFAAEPTQVLEWMLGQGLAATLAAYGNADEGRARLREGTVAATRWTGSLRDAMQARPGHYELLTGLHRAAFTAGGELLFVHAGVDPHRPLTEQGDTFWWGSGYFADIDAPYQGFRKVVRGYDRNHAGFAAGPFTATLDGGAGFGGTLNAACLDLDGRIVEWIEV